MILLGGGLVGPNSSTGNDKCHGPFKGHWQKGVRVDGVYGWWGRRLWIGVEIHFFLHRSVREEARFWVVLHPRAKIRRCRSMSKLCPHTTALPVLPQGNKYITNHCITWCGLGGRCYHILVMSTQLHFCLSFLKARERPSKYLFLVRRQDHKLDCGKNMGLTLTSS